MDAIRGGVFRQSEGVPAIGEERAVALGGIQRRTKAQRSEVGDELRGGLAFGRSQDRIRARRSRSVRATAVARMFILMPTNVELKAGRIGPIERILNRKKSMKPSTWRFDHLATLRWARCHRADHASI